MPINMWYLRSWVISTSWITRKVLYLHHIMLSIQPNMFHRNIQSADDWNGTAEITPFLLFSIILLLQSLFVQVMETAVQQHIINLKSSGLKFYEIHCKRVGQTNWWIALKIKRISIIESFNWKSVFIKDREGIAALLLGPQLRNVQWTGTDCWNLIAFLEICNYFRECEYLVMEFFMQNQYNCLKNSI